LSVETFTAQGRNWLLCPNVSIYKLLSIECDRTLMAQDRIK